MNTQFFRKFSRSSFLVVVALFLKTDSYLLAQHHPGDTSDVYKMIELGDKKNEINELDSAEYYYNEAGSLARRLNFDNGFMEYTGHYTGFLYRQSRYQEALEIAQQQLETGLRTNSKSKTANAYNNIAVQYQAMGNMQEAAKSLMQALDISATLNDVVNQQKYNTNLGSLFIDLKDYKKAVQYARKGHELAVELKDTIKIGRSLVNLLVAETMSNNLDKAVEYAKEALMIGERYNNIDLTLTAYCNLGDIYIRKKEYQKGLETFKKALPLLNESPPDYEVYVLQGIASAYKYMGKYQEANNYFIKALPAAEVYLPKSEFSILLLAGSEIKEAIGDFREALFLRNRYQSLNDSLLNENTQRTIHELEIQYQTAEREMKMARQQSEIDRRNKWIIFSSLVVVLLIALLIFNHKINQQKQRTIESNHRNKLLKAQLDGEEEERSRTARELHDGVASVLSAAKLQLNLANDLQDISIESSHQQLKSLIEQALQEVRNISHNMAAEIVSSEGLDCAVREFCNRVSNPKLRVEYFQMGTMPEISKSDELLIYRSIQEAVTNIVKHANASEALVQIVADGNKLSITIEDNGSGFDMNHIGTSGIGLRSLASRVHLLNGVYEVHSAPGKGTSIYIECEFEEKRQEKIMQPANETYA